MCAAMGKSAEHEDIGISLVESGAAIKTTNVSINSNFFISTLSYFFNIFSDKRVYRSSLCCFLQPQTTRKTSNQEI